MQLARAGRPVDVRAACWQRGLGGMTRQTAQEREGKGSSIVGS